MEKSRKRAVDATRRAQESLTELCLKVPEALQILVGAQTPLVIWVVLKALGPFCL